MHDDDARPLPVTDRRPPAIARLLGLGTTRNPDDPRTPAYGLDVSGDAELRQLADASPDPVPEQLAAPPERRGVPSGPNGAVVLAMLPLAANAGPVGIPRVPGQLVRLTLWTVSDPAATSSGNSSGVWLGAAGYGNPVNAGVQLAAGVPLQLVIAGDLVAGAGASGGTLYIASEVLVP